MLALRFALRRLLELGGKQGGQPSPDVRGCEAEQRQIDRAARL